MSKNVVSVTKSLEKKAKKGFKGYPLTTVAFYGPTDKLATKVAIGIIFNDSAEPIIRQWYSKTDIRNNTEVMEEILNLIRDNDIRSVVMIDKIIGCPHEEGIDYPEGVSCSACPYWSNRDRWGESVH
jgi:hypothetical protein